MQNTYIYIKVVIACLFGVVVNFLGGWDTALQTLLTLTVLDFITGVLTAIVNKNLSSSIAAKGIVKKIGIYALIAAVVAAGDILGNSDLRGIVISFFIITEIISIVENWADFGLPIPPQLKTILADLKNSTTDTTNN